MFQLLPRSNFDVHDQLLDETLRYVCMLNQSTTEVNIKSQSSYRSRRIVYQLEKKCRWRDKVWLGSRFSTCWVKLIHARRHESRWHRRRSIPHLSRWERILSSFIPYKIAPQLLTLGRSNLLRRRLAHLPWGRWLLHELRIER